MQPKYIDPVSGVTHDYCSKSHAEEGKQKGIRGSYKNAIMDQNFRCKIFIDGLKILHAHYNLTIPTIKFVNFGGENSQIYLSLSYYDPDELTFQLKQTNQRRSVNYQAAQTERGQRPEESTTTVARITLHRTYKTELVMVLTVVIIVVMMHILFFVVVFLYTL